MKNQIFSFFCQSEGRLQEHAHTVFLIFLLWKVKFLLDFLLSRVKFSIFLGNKGHCDREMFAIDRALFVARRNAFCDSVFACSFNFHLHYLTLFTTQNYR